MPENGCGVYKTGLTAARWCDTICSALRCSSAASSLVEREPPPCTQKRTQTTTQRQKSLAPGEFPFPANKSQSAHACVGSSAMIATLTTSFGVTYSEMAFVSSVILIAYTISPTIAGARPLREEKKESQRRRV